MRLVGALEESGTAVWVVALPRRSVRVCSRLVAMLPGESAAIVAVDVCRPDCIAVLRQRAPVVQVGLKETASRRTACVVHDTQLEAGEIVRLAAERGAEQIACIGAVRRVAGRRRICYADARLVSLLAMEGQNHHISVPAHLQMWADAGQPLTETGGLARWTGYDLSKTVLVVDGSAWAGEVTEQLGDKSLGGIVCRDWRGDADGRWVTVGPDLDLLTTAVLQRVTGAAGIPEGVAMAVPPKWIGRQ